MHVAPHGVHKLHAYPFPEGMPETCPIPAKIPNGTETLKRQQLTTYALGTRDLTLHRCLRILDYTSKSDWFSEELGNEPVESHN